MSRLVMIDQEDIPDHWANLRTLFKEALNKGHGEYDLGSILDQASRGNVKLAFIENGAEILMALAMEIKMYPQMKVLYVTAMAGKRMAEAFKQHHQEIAEFAKSCGATKFEAAGSPAMAKMLCDSGWYDVNQTVRFDI